MSWKRIFFHPVGHFFLVLVYGGVLVPASARAEGIPRGKVVFYPSLEVNYLSEDNVFLLNENDPISGQISSNQQFYKATFKLEMPFSQSHTSISYSPRFRDYSSDAVSLSDRLSHYFDFETELNFSSGFRLLLTERFVRDNVAVQEIPGNQGEVQFGIDTFQTNDVGIGFEYPLLPRHRLGGEIHGKLVRFSTEETPSFFDTTGIDAALNYEFRLSPNRNLRLEFRHGSTEQERTALFFLAQAEDYVENSFLLGFHGTGRRNLSYNLEGGYGDLRFQKSNESDFSGFVGRFTSSFLLGPRLTFRGRASRDAFPSFFDAPNFYVSNSVGLSLEREIGQRFFWTADASAQWNRYPDPIPDPPIFPSNIGSIGVRRKDRMQRFEIGAGVQFLRTLSAGLTYRYEKRDSNILTDFGTGLFERFNYDASAIGVQVKFGWF